MSDAQAVAFDKGGKYLYFTASTDVGPLQFGSMSAFNRAVTSSAYVVVLSKDDPSPLLPESDDEKDAPAKPADKPADKDKAKKDAPKVQHRPGGHRPAHPGPAGAGPQLRRPRGRQGGDGVPARRRAGERRPPRRPAAIDRPQVRPGQAQDREGAGAGRPTGRLPRRREDAVPGRPGEVVPDLHVGPAQAGRGSGQARRTGTQGGSARRVGADLPRNLANSSATSCTTRRLTGWTWRPLARSTSPTWPGSAAGTT